MFFFNNYLLLFYPLFLHVKNVNKMLTVFLVIWWKRTNSLSMVQIIP